MTEQNYRNAEHATEVLLNLGAAQRKTFWVKWPIMPLKNKSDGRMGFLIDLGDTEGFKIFEGNIFMDVFGCKIENILRLPSQAYESVSGAMADGWIVD